MPEKTGTHSGRSTALTDWDLGVQPYGPVWRVGRKHFHEHFRRGVVHRYHASQKREVRAFLRRALDFEGKLDSRFINQYVQRAQPAAT